MKQIFILFLVFSMFASVVYADKCTEGDCQNGQGTMTFPDGTKYVGQLKDDKQNGQGTMTYPDGRKESGQWEDGYFISQ